MAAQGATWFASDYTKTPGSKRRCPVECVLKAAVIMADYYLMITKLRHETRTGQGVTVKQG